MSCFVSTNRVERTSFCKALLRSLRGPIVDPPKDAKLQTLEEISKDLSTRIIAIFPGVTSRLPPTKSRYHSQFPSWPSPAHPLNTIIKYSNNSFSQPQPTAAVSFP